MKTMELDTKPLSSVWYFEWRKPNDFVCRCVHGISAAVTMQQKHYEVKWFLSDILLAIESLCTAAFFFPGKLTGFYALEILHGCLWHH